jgi:type IV fimbrial biogenesis protein FimT
VTVCPLSAQNQCTDDWQQTISIFLDTDNNKQPDNGNVIRILKLDKPGFSLRSRTAGRGYFQFDTRGMTHGAMGSLVLCPRRIPSGAMTYMAVNIAGRFRAVSDRDGDGKITLPWGADILC